MSKVTIIINTTVSDVIFTCCLVLRRLDYGTLSLSRVCKDIRGLIAEYLYETVNKIDDYGYRTNYTSINGVFHGLLRGLWKSGKLEREFMYKNGNKHGLARYWYESGKLKYEEMYKNGKLHGLTQRWYKSGELQSEFMYADGDLHGITRRWYKSGKLYYESVYKNGIKEQTVTRY